MHGEYGMKILDLIRPISIKYNLLEFWFLIHKLSMGNVEWGRVHYEGGYEMPAMLPFFKTSDHKFLPCLWEVQE